MPDQAVLVSPDLMLASQVELDCRRGNVGFKTAGIENWVEVSKDARWVFWDLSHGLPTSESIEDLRREQVCSIIALGPHVDEAKLQQARDAGCDHVLPRGRFLRELSIILAGEPKAG